MRKLVPGLYYRFVIVGVAGAISLGLCGEAAAQSADEAAIPVRKKASASSSESEEVAAPAAKKSSALTRLQSASSKPSDSEKSKSSSAEKSESSADAPSKSTAAKASSREDADAPVSKSSKSETASAKSSASKKPEPEKATSREKSAASSNSEKSRSAGDADVAALDNLKASKSKSREDQGDESDKKESAKSSESKADSKSASAEKSSQESAPSEDSEAVAYSEETLKSNLPAEEHDAGEAVATVPAPIFTEPNVYVPQTQEKQGLFSRLFSRHKQQPASLRPQSSFSSDYATRGDAVLPAVIDGNGYNGADLPIGGEDQYRLASLPSSFRPTDLVQLPVGCCHYGNQLYLRREAAMALNNMINEAARQGLTLHVVSAYRDYGHQLRLYNQAVARGGENQKSVARPGKSEHHLGTTVDLTNTEAHALKRSFGDTAEGKWLAANAHRFGWKMTVMSGNGRRSHNDEPWHLRYLGSSVNAPAGQSNIANTNSQPQRRTILGSVARMLGLGKR